MKKTDELVDSPITIYTENGIQNISPSQFPEVIEASLKRMEDLDKQYRKAELSAKNAASKVDDAKKAADTAKSDAISAVNKSNEVSDMSTGWFKNKDAIDGLQKGHVKLAKSQKGIADAVMQLTDVQSGFAKAQADTMEALWISFEFDKDISNITKYLFLLGCTSITASQTVCRTLELKLRDASEEEISDFARAELQSVVDNLKAQEGMMQKQRQIEEELDIFIDVVNSNTESISEHAKTLKKHAEEIQKRVDKENELAEGLRKQEGINRQQAKELNKREKVDEEHDRRLDAGDIHDREQDEKLEAQGKKDEEHDRRLDAGDIHDREQDEKLETHGKKDEEHDRRLDAGDIHDQEQDVIIEILKNEVKKNEEEIDHLKAIIEEVRNTTSNSVAEIDSKIQEHALKKEMYITGVIGIVSLIIGIIHFIL